MPSAQPDPGSALLPTVGVPGTFEWSEEVVECMNAAWRTRETGEQAFVAAVRAAIQHRIWEILSPPPPEEPYTSLDSLIRHTADGGQAENMQIAIRFSGILDEAKGTGVGPNQAAEAALPATAFESLAGALAALPSYGGQGMAEDEQVALGNALLEQLGQQAMVPGLDSQALAGMVAAFQAASAIAVPKTTPAQRKRERLERTYPDLAEAVRAGELTLKQAYIQAGIEKEVRTLDKLQRLWRSASTDERDHFLSWLDEQVQHERRRRYEEQVYGEDA